MASDSSRLSFPPAFVSLPICEIASFSLSGTPALPVRVSIGSAMSSGPPEIPSPCRNPDLGSPPGLDHPRSSALSGSPNFLQPGRHQTLRPASLRHPELANPRPTTRHFSRSVEPARPGPHPGRGRRTRASCQSSSGCPGKASYRRRPWPPPGGLEITRKWYRPPHGFHSTHRHSFQSHRLP